MVTEAEHFVAVRRGFVTSTVRRLLPDLTYILGGTPI